MTSKAERTKQFIIEKTAPIFNTKGYAGTSLNDMMAVTGLTKGSIYGNFDNKDAVALAAFAYNFRLVIVYIKEEMDKYPSYIDKLLVYPNTYRKYHKLPFLKNGCPVANTSTEADDTHPALKEKVNAAIGYWRNSVEKQLKAGIKSGEINPATNIVEVCGVLTALIQGAVLHAKASGKMQYLNASMDYLENFIKNLKN
ncbi:MAG: TetR/AcrR family transcriptional regulator [Bacteroidetes bacterium]|nr:MAG: TetR/AcrR family transcriptional regulator [Bacteroidota bacterium]